MSGYKGDADMSETVDIAERELASYQPLLRSPNGSGEPDVHTEELRLAPLVWWSVMNHINNSTDPESRLKQYGVLGYEPSKDMNLAIRPPVLLNTNAPWSAFLCGSQGSGKSHTLSCMLENCLLNTPEISKNPHPLSGLVLHYDGSRGNGVCEAAYLCSQVKTKVLVSASNYGNLKRQYEEMAEKCGGTIEVHKLLIRPSHLDTERVKTLMAVAKDGEAPLYIQTLVKLIRDIAITNGGVGTFDYATFKERLARQMFSEGQNQPLKLRIDLLEAFLDIPPESTSESALEFPPKTAKSTKPLPEPCFTPSATPQSKPSSWSESPDYLAGQPGELLIVDLTDPVIDVDMACVLFDTCLSIFLAQTTCGKVVALDEAHNYLLADNAAAKQFTGKLLKTIREQRHIGARIIIATQEPTLDTSLLDLCSITMVHRCSSPAWFEVLKKHVAGMYLSSAEESGDGKLAGRNTTDRTLLRQIVGLRLGESLLFCPTATTEFKDGELRRMLDKFVTFRTRGRFTADGGRTRLADNA